MTNPTQTITVLRRAQSLIATPDRWAQGTFQRDIRKGCAYCALGAINAAAHDAGALAFFPAYDALKIATGSTRTGLAKWNDAPERTHAEVLDAFDRAILMVATEPAP